MWALVSLKETIVPTPPSVCSDDTLDDALNALNLVPLDSVSAQGCLTAVPPFPTTDLG